MIDFANIVTKAGAGGNGCGSFDHVKGKRRGKADGGDGGRGGNVYLVATRDLNTLEPFRYIKEYKAKNGESGLSKRRKGAEGEDLYIKVPVGTQVKVRQESENSKLKTPNSKLQTQNLGDASSTSGSLSFDLVDDQQSALVARGGEAGRGNSHLRDEYGRRPKSGERGEEGEVVHMSLELKLLAQVGLIGLPNAGKSTILSKLTSAAPKIAPYPFTTLQPHLGVMSTDYRLQTTAVDNGQSTVDKSVKLIIADIPGLIAGASEGKGLGDTFLRHIERTGLLVHIIDVTGDVLVNYQIIRDELNAYSKDLVKKKEIIVLNKIDLIDTNISESLKREFSKKRKTVVCVSAVSGEGLDKLRELIFKKI
jgi:GTP-binding protein